MISRLSAVLVFNLYRDYAGTVTAECEAMVLESTMRSGRVLDLLSKRQEGGEAKEEKEKEGGGGGS